MHRPVLIIGDGWEEAFDIHYIENSDFLEASDTELIEPTSTYYLIGDCLEKLSLESINNILSEFNMSIPTKTINSISEFCSSLDIYNPDHTLIMNRFLEEKDIPDLHVVYNEDKKPLVQITYFTNPYGEYDYYTLGGRYEKTLLVNHNDPLAEHNLENNTYYNCNTSAQYVNVSSMIEFGYFPSDVFIQDNWIYDRESLLFETLLRYNGVPVDEAESMCSQSLLTKDNILHLLFHTLPKDEGIRMLDIHF